MMTEYRIYTLDGASRIVGCREAVCSDDQQAFLVAPILADTGAGFEVWQNQRLVGRSVGGAPPGNGSRRLLTGMTGLHEGAGQARPAPSPASAPDHRAQAAPPWFIAVGASGSEGLGDIVALLRAIPKPVGAVVLVVLHRPRDRVSHLRQVLAARCGMPVAIACEGENFAVGTCYIGEPDAHLTILRSHLAHLVPDVRGLLRNRTVDALFHSVAAYAGPHSVGIVLSGSLDDGARGMAAIHAAHGLTMVLDPGAKPRGMQQNAIDYDGPISFIGTAAEIAARLGRLVGPGTAALPPGSARR